MIYYFTQITFSIVKCIHNIKHNGCYTYYNQVDYHLVALFGVPNLNMSIFKRLLNCILPWLIIVSYYIIAPG